MDQRAEWPVLPECPGLLHNSLNAATKGPVRTRCVCPRGLELKESDSRRRTVEKRELRAELASDEPLKTPGYEKNYRQNVPRPDLRGGRCNTAGGRELVDAYNGPPTERPAGVLAAHRTMCKLCPVVAECRTWALEGESIPGSWGGIYGGLIAAERRDLKRRRGNRAA